MVTVPSAGSWNRARVFLWGDSAGGHLALMTALTGAEVPNQQIRGVVAWFPVTDLAGLAGDVIAAVDLELVPGATHFWNGAGDVDAIVRRSVEFLRAL